MIIIVPCHYAENEWLHFFTFRVLLHPVPDQLGVDRSGTEGVDPHAIRFGAVL